MVVNPVTRLPGKASFSQVAPKGIINTSRTASVPVNSILVPPPPTQPTQSKARYSSISPRQQQLQRSKVIPKSVHFIKAHQDLKNEAQLSKVTEIQSNNVKIDLESIENKKISTPKALKDSSVSPKEMNNPNDAKVSAQNKESRSKSSNKAPVRMFRTASSLQNLIDESQKNLSSLQLEYQKTLRQIENEQRTLAFSHKELKTYHSKTVLLLNLIKMVGEQEEEDKKTIENLESQLTMQIDIKDDIDNQGNIMNNKVNQSYRGEDIKRENENILEKELEALIQEPLSEYFENGSNVKEYIESKLDIIGGILGEDLELNFVPEVYGMEGA